MQLVDAKIGLGVHGSSDPIVDIDVLSLLGVASDMDLLDARFFDVCVS